jgi:hypothetical protein
MVNVLVYDSLIERYKEENCEEDSFTTAVTLLPNLA